MVYIKQFFLVILTIATSLKSALSRPQNEEPFYPEPSVQRNSAIEKTHTQEILEKIAKVNKEHGLGTRKTNSNKVQQQQHQHQQQQVPGFFTGDLRNFKYLLDDYRLEELQSRSVDSIRNIVYGYLNHHHRQQQQQQQQQIPNPYYYHSYYQPGPVYYDPRYRTNVNQFYQNEYVPVLIQHPFQLVYNSKAQMFEVTPSPTACPKDNTSGRQLKEENAPNRTNNKEFVFDNLNIPVNESDKTEIYRVLNKLQEKSVSPTSQSSTSTTSSLKRPAIFKPGTWFNNKFPRPQNNTQAPEELLEDVEDKGLFPDRRKVFSKDNTGSGIFIHKLKVRKGGVAIAGPGGIATAGSGGTAIVGPNGYAFTHPDSLAIAGTGSKVIAVDPNVNLGDLVRNNTLNKGHRIGRVVATGPVVYYNRG